MLSFRGNLRLHGIELYVTEWTGRAEEISIPRLGIGQLLFTEIQGHLFIDAELGETCFQFSCPLSQDQWFHPDTKPLVNVVINLLVAFFAGSVMCYGGYILVSRTLAAGQASPAVGIEMGYVYLAVPISGFFILIFCAENIAEALMRRNPGMRREEAG